MYFNEKKMNVLGKIKRKIYNLSHPAGSRIDATQGRR
mgnify:CR=1 FL=1